MAKLEDVCEILDNRRIPITAKDRVAGQYPYYGANGVQDYVADYIFDDELVLLAEDGGHFGSADKPIAYRVSGKCWVNNHAHVLKPREYIDVDYLCYSLMFRDVSDIVNGATRQKLTQADMRKIEIPLLSMTEQKAVVDKLGKVFELIALRKEQLAKLDQLVKSRFVELFGGGNNNSEPLKSFLEDITYGFTNPMPDAEEGPWKVTAKDVVNGKVNYDTARKTTVQAFEELTAKSKPTVGDVLLTKDGTLGRCAVVEEEGICVNQSVAVLKCNKRILPKFLAILLQMPEYQREMLKNAGGGTIKHIYITKVVDMLIVVPTISQQMEFLSFVEQTDKSKLAIQQSLDKLEMLKKSLMQEYFG